MSEIDLVSSTEVIVNVWWQQGEWQCLLQWGGWNKQVAQVTEKFIKPSDATFNHSFNFTHLFTIERFSHHHAVHLLHHGEWSGAHCLTHSLQSQSAHCWSMSTHWAVIFVSNSHSFFWDIFFENKQCKLTIPRPFKSLNAMTILDHFKFMTADSMLALITCLKQLQTVNMKQSLLTYLMLVQTLHRVLWKWCLIKYMVNIYIKVNSWCWCKKQQIYLDKFLTSMSIFIVSYVLWLLWCLA